MCRKDWLGRFVSSQHGILAGLCIDQDAKVLQKVNSRPLTYNNVHSPQKELQVNDEGLVQHFINFAKHNNLGQIGMLWQDWASLSGAGCFECIALAKEHAVAVDFAKTGIPASIPDVARWKQPWRAHWREKKDVPSKRCDSVIGILYDQVIGHDDLPNHINTRIALAGRTLDRYGQVLSIVPEKLTTERLISKSTIQGSQTN